ncbi:hypothetical protein SNE40_019824 [Patella caerulea]|uniref:Uncharacterized protein n=1 Tax=Patella caerulea TaxID=87958 RepID=A0AAN8GJP0_PATCE
MRFKDNKGDPHGFRVFLSDHKLPQSLIIRYRGNRLHVLFKLAAVYVTHFEAINLYLTTRCLNNSTLKTGLIADFSHPVAYLELKILAILGKVLTGPWMKHFYRGKNEQMHHMDAFNEVNMCSVKVEALMAKDEIKLSDFTEDFFGEKLDHSEDPLIWKDDVDGNQFSMTMKALLKAVFAVIQRQYKNYYNMEDTAERRQILESARTHNIDSEEVMGMFSANIARAPRATLLFVSSKIRSKKNDTLKFIESHPDKANIIKKSVSLAAHLKRKTQKSIEDLQKELSCRIANKMQKKEQTERRKIQRPRPFIVCKSLSLS